MVCLRILVVLIWIKIVLDHWIHIIHRSLLAQNGAIVIRLPEWRLVFWQPLWYKLIVSFSHLYVIILLNFGNWFFIEIKSKEVIWSLFELFLSFFLQLLNLICRQVLILKTSLLLPKLWLLIVLRGLYSLRYQMIFSTYCHCWVLTLLVSMHLSLLVGTHELRFVIEKLVKISILLCEVWCFAYEVRDFWGWFLHSRRCIVATRRAVAVQIVCW